MSLGLSWTSSIYHKPSYWSCQLTNGQLTLTGTDTTHHIHHLMGIVYTSPFLARRGQLLENFAFTVHCFQVQFPWVSGKPQHRTKPWRFAGPISLKRIVWPVLTHRDHKIAVPVYHFAIFSPRPAERPTNIHSSYFACYGFTSRISDHMFLVLNQSSNCGVINELTPVPISVRSFFAWFATWSRMYLPKSMSLTSRQFKSHLFDLCVLHSNHSFTNFAGTHADIYATPIQNYPLD